LTEFKDLGLAKPLLRALEHEGYTTPTPIQEQAIPVMAQGRDILGIAQTGTGKTAAFVLPILDALQEFKKENKVKPKTAFGLIIAPTRELAAQIVASVRKYGYHMRPEVALIVGGVRPFPQIKQMSKGVDIIVATPGRLLDYVERGQVLLNRTAITVLDEADQMMDMGFIPAIRKIMRALPREGQTVLFSATMPAQVAALADDFLQDAVEIEVAPQSQPIERIDQQFIGINGGAKRDMLLKLLKNEDVKRSIIFTRTKRGADKLEQVLEQAGFRISTIHGDKNQRQRDRALQSFRTGRTMIMLATDVAARGIDVDDVSHVINFDLPTVPEAYVHRIGRTARAGKSGVAISFYERKDYQLVKAIEKLIGQEFGLAPAPKPQNTGAKKKKRRYDPQKPAAPFKKAKRSQSRHKGARKAA
jgi:ATP-dependent RNA helicase RhlE